MANVEFGTGKTVIILSIVVACFAVLWPKILYPMITGNINKGAESNTLDGCCDVMFETDINAIKIMNDLCGSILNRRADFNPKLSQAFQQGKLTKEVINTCRNEVLNICGIDIAEFLNKKEKISKSYKHMLDEIRSFNISLCLRHNFGVNPALLGTPRRMRIWNPSTQKHLRQERPMRFRPEIVHPALREKGRAIPQSHVVPKVFSEKEHARPSPMPVIGRPPMGGAGHVVPPPKVGGLLNVAMPLYTIGIVLFFTYTVMKIYSRKTKGDNEYKNFHSDPEFRRVVFSEDYSNGCARGIDEEKSKTKGKQGIRKSATDDCTRLGDIEIDQLRKRLEETEKAMERIVAQMETVPSDIMNKTQITLRSGPKSKKNLEECTEEIQQPKKVSEALKQVDAMKKGVSNEYIDLQQESKEIVEDAKPKVKVMGLELMAECEGGQKWSRPASPTLGVGGSSRSTTPIPPPYSPEPQNIFLEGTLPQQSQLLVTDSKTQTLTFSDGDEPEPPVILSSKMTLSLISLDSPVPDGNSRPTKFESISQADLKSECESAVCKTADSTLLDLDSEIIDEMGRNESLNESFEQEENSNQKVYKNLQEKQSVVNTTEITQKQEATQETEPEDTTADISNLDGFDIMEDQEVFQNENPPICNGNLKQTDDPQEQPEKANPEQE